MARFTDKQEKFCELVAMYGFRPSDAVVEAGYSCYNNAKKHDIAYRLMNDVHISSHIAEIREKVFDPDAIRRSVILEHLLTRSFDLSRVIENRTEVNDAGIEFTRVIVKPTSEWPWEARQLFTGHYDKFNRPIFKGKTEATKELSRIFGLYKDNVMREEEDTAGVLSSAGLTPSVGIEYAVDKEPDDGFDGSALDAEFLGVVEKPAEEEADDDYDVDDYFGWNEE